MAESAMLQEGTALLAMLTSQAPQAAAKEALAARSCAEEAAQEFVFSACRHLYFQRAELQLLLRRLLFCAAELSSRRYALSMSQNYMRSASQTSDHVGPWSLVCLGRQLYIVRMSVLSLNQRL